MPFSTQSKTRLITDNNTFSSHTSSATRLPYLLVKGPPETLAIPDHCKVAGTKGCISGNQTVEYNLKFVRCQCKLECYINLPWTSIRRQTSRLKWAILSPVCTARRSTAPERSGSPSCPSDIFFVICHILDQILDIRLTLCSVSGSKFSDHCFEAVLLEPSCKTIEVCGCTLNTFQVTAWKVRIQIFVYIKSWDRES